MAGRRRQNEAGWLSPAPDQGSPNETDAVPLKMAKPTGDLLPPASCLLR